MWKVVAIVFVALAIMAIVSYNATGVPTTEQRNELLRQQLIKERETNQLLHNKFRREIRSLRRVTHDVRYPTPEGNKRLAKAYFGKDYYAAAEIINGETGGTWRHDIWNGFHLGAWPERSDFDGACDVGEAYGLGQACERDKMLAYGSDAYTNPLTQLIWFEKYAKDRYGSVQGAAAHWTPTRSW